MDNAQNIGDPDMIYQLQCDLDRALLQQEECLYQRSYISWIVSGDLYTAFFHKKATIRHHKNHISSLQDKHGIWSTNNHQLGAIMQLYFHQLFFPEGATLHYINNLSINPLYLVDNAYLNSLFSAEAIKNVV